MNSHEVRIRDLADSIRATLRDGGDADAVAAALDTCRPTPDLLTGRQRHGSPDAAAAHLLHADDDFSIVALVWRPGQVTRIHDHRCWCVVYVLQGSEQETRYEDHGDFLVETGTVRNPVGSVSALTPPGDIHRIHNDTDEVAISLHVYGIDLRVAGSSARRTYDAPVRSALELAAQS